MPEPITAAGVVVDTTPATPVPAADAATVAEDHNLTKKSVKNDFFNMSVNEICQEAVKNGGKIVKSVKIEDAVVSIDDTAEDKPAQVTIKFEEPCVKAFIANEDGVFEEKVVDYIVARTYAISGLFKKARKGYLGRYIVRKPTALELLLPGAEVDILQQPLAANTWYYNPFSTKETTTARRYATDRIINNVVGIVFDAQGKRQIEKIEDKLL